MDYSKFDLDNLVFEDDEISFKAVLFFMSILGISNEVFITIARKKKTFFLSNKSSIGVIAEAIGLDKSEYKNLLEYHIKRDNLRSSLAPFIGGAFSAVAILLTLAIFNLLLSNFINNPVIVGFLNFMVFWLMLNLSIRLFLLLFEKRFVETICMNSIFHIILLLRRDDVFSRPDKKKLLLTMIRYFAKRIELFTIAYRSSDPGNSEWIHHHFFQLSQYIRERERWVVAPQQDTLQIVRNDFYDLAITLVSGNLGDFKWAEGLTKTTFVKVDSSTGSIKEKIIRFIGYLTPVILIGLYLWQPTFFPIIKIDSEVATIVLLAWLLLSIDVGLRLGIVTSLIRFAMDIRDLSKIR
jgi:hypothetical protein